MHLHYLREILREKSREIPYYNYNDLSPIKEIMKIVG